MILKQFKKNIPQQLCVLSMLSCGIVCASDTLPTLQEDTSVRPALRYVPKQVGDEYVLELEGESPTSTSVEIDFDYPSDSEELAEELAYDASAGLLYHHTIEPAQYKARFSSEDFSGPDHRRAVQDDQRKGELITLTPHLQTDSPLMTTGRAVPIPSTSHSEEISLEGEKKERQNIAELVGTQGMVSLKLGGNYYAEHKSIQSTNHDREENVQEVGKDKRLPILLKNDLKAVPNRSIGLLESFLGNNCYLGSGTIIGNRYVLTAAHNVWIKPHGHTHSYLPGKIQFSPASRGKARPLIVEASQISIPRQFLVNRDSAYDYALLVLNKDVTPFGRVPIAAFNDTQLPSLKVSITGYPGNMPHYKCMYRGDGEIVSFSGRSLSHNVDTTGGNSGSGILHTKTEQVPPLHRIIGVHTLGGYPNSGVRFTPDIINELAGYINAFQDGFNTTVH